MNPALYEIESPIHKSKRVTMEPNFNSSHKSKNSFYSPICNRFYMVMPNDFEKIAIENMTAGFLLRCQNSLMEMIKGCDFRKLNY
jgi:hypothetical protein